MFMEVSNVHRLDSLHACYYHKFVNQGAYNNDCWHPKIEYCHNLLQNITMSSSLVSDLNERSFCCLLDERVFVTWKIHPIKLGAGGDVRAK